MEKLCVTGTAAICVLRGAGRRNNADATAQSRHRVFFRAPQGFPGEGTARGLWSISREVLITMTTAAVEGSSPKAPLAQGSSLLGQHWLRPGLTMDEQWIEVNTSDLWLLHLSGGQVQDGGVWPRNKE